MITIKSRKKDKILLAIALTIAILARLIPVVAVAALFIDTDSEQYEDKVIMSLPDYADGHEWIYGFWQDYTCYSEYKYDCELNQYFASEENIYFKPVDFDVKCRINLLLNDYEEWVRMTENPDSITGDDISKVYSFKRTQIDDSDWYYCNVEGFESPDIEEACLYADYDLYFFDTQTGTLYYMHNNI